MKYICVFGASQNAVIDKYLPHIKVLAKHIVDNGYGLIYGGGNVGLMKAIHDEVKARLNSNVVQGIKGVVTPIVVELGVVQTGIELIQVETYSNRKEKMLSEAVGYVALPGGLGTLDESVFAMIMNQFALSSGAAKPLVLLNIDNFYEGLQIQLKRQLQEKMLTREHFDLIKFTVDPAEVVPHIQNFKSPKPNKSEWWDEKVDSKLSTLSVKLGSPVHSTKDDIVTTTLEVDPEGMVKLNFALK